MFLSCNVIFHKILSVIQLKANVKNRLIVARFTFLLSYRFSKKSKSQIFHLDTLSQSVAVLIFNRSNLLLEDRIGLKYIEIRNLPGQGFFAKISPGHIEKLLGKNQNTSHDQLISIKTTPGQTTFCNFYLVNHFESFFHPVESDRLNDTGCIGSFTKCGGMSFS